MPLKLALRYNFERVENNLVSDASGQGHRGKLEHGERVAGRKGQALRLNGQGHLSVVSVPASLNPAQKPFTVGAWIRPEQPDGVVISWGGGAQGFSLYVEKGVPHFALRSGSELSAVRGQERVPPGAWTHLSAMLQASGELSLLVNGRSVGSTNAPPIRRKPAEGLTIGADPGSHVGDYAGPLPWQRLIEDVRLYWGEPDRATLQEWRSKVHEQ